MQWHEFAIRMPRRSLNRADSVIRIFLISFVLVLIVSSYVCFSVCSCVPGSLRIRLRVDNSYILPDIV